MALTEQTGKRTAEELYSAWHRPASIRRFIEPGVDADSLGLINIDHIVRCARWAEYCRTCSRTLLLIETALGLHSTHKTASVTAKLARDAGCQAFIVLVEATPSGDDIAGFRVKRIEPDPTGWFDFTPDAWARKLVELRQGSQRCAHCPDNVVQIAEAA